MWEDAGTVVCPHCYGRSAACCECHGAKVIPAWRLFLVMDNVWARGWCYCPVCQDLRRQRPPEAA